jgi:hypothetical protein
MMKSIKDLFGGEYELMGNDDFAKAAVAANLEKMFRPDGYFSICDFDKCCKALDVSCDNKTKALLDPLHCIHWNTMPPKMRTETFARVMLVLSKPKEIEFKASDIAGMLGSGSVAVKEGRRIRRMLTHNTDDVIDV